MKKNIFIALVVFFVAVISYFSYLVLTTRSHSPFDTVNYQSEGLVMSISYCQPYKKGRLIFGDEGSGALVPYGQYWRLGANDATELTVDSDIDFGGQKVVAGKYRMYAVPNKEYWEVSLNSEIGQFGYFTPNYELDVAKINVPVQRSNEVYEQLTAKIFSRSGQSYLAFYWDDTLVEIPISKKN